MPLSLRQRLKRSDSLLGWYRRHLQHATDIRFFTDSDFRNHTYQQWVRQIEKSRVPPPSNGRMIELYVWLRNVDYRVESTLTSLPEGCHVIVEEQSLLSIRLLIERSSNLRNKGLRLLSHKQLQAIVDSNTPKSGAWLCTLSSGARLGNFTALYLADAAHINSAAKVIYFDHDEVAVDGQRINPVLKPGWDLDFYLGTEYIREAVFFDLSLLKNSEIISPENLLLSFKPKFRDERIQHVEYIGFHLVDDGVIDNESHVDNYGICQSMPDTQPLVSIIIPTRDEAEVLRRCLDSVFAHTSYTNYEVIVINHDSVKAESLQYFTLLQQDARVHVIDYHGEFNYSAMNNRAVEHASGDYLLFLNNDTEVLSPGWLTDMLSLACRSETGCVGAKLFYPDGRIQHAGVVIDQNAVASHWHKLMPGDHKGYMHSLIHNRRFHAVTAACMMVKTSLFNEVGGFDEASLAVAFNDVDLCLKVEALEKINVYCASAHLIHHESLSRGEDNNRLKAQRFASEKRVIRERWALSERPDRAINKQLSEMLKLAH
ncbi:glycosyltransferase family 2 protein [Aestuariibacter salexigens]|uniref:glycosyltransferase family 2 protein n=1 Tax=Aestuariibacter salexigens TaxID=226010 RepID=UPI0009FFD777|nr:glycosyltransferase family 2 protein [Aestuariibacter salexigens]